MNKEVREQYHLVCQDCGRLFWNINGFVDKCPECAGYRQLFPEKLTEVENILKDFVFIPDCGGDFCFLATEGMENECDEPEEGIGNCPHKGYCRWANAYQIKRDKALKIIEGIK